MSFDVIHFQNQTLSDVSRIQERLIAVACFFLWNIILWKDIF